MSAIEPIDNRIKPVEPVRRPIKRGPREERDEQPQQEPGERKQREQDRPSGGGLVDVRV
jgi:hypothetical protein